MTTAVVAGVLTTRTDSTPTALVFSQFRHGMGRYYVYLDPMRGISARQFRPLHDVTPFQDRPLSPDGTALITVRPTVGGVDLFVLEIPEGTQRQLTRLEAFPPVHHSFNQMRSNTYPVWSPDGAWIAFISSDRMANMDIFLISPDGEELRRVAHDVSTRTLTNPVGSFQERAPDGFSLLGVVSIYLSSNHFKTLSEQLIDGVGEQNGYDFGIKLGYMAVGIAG
jgi:hypothetical protein